MLACPPDTSGAMVLEYPSSPKNQIAAKRLIRPLRKFPPISLRRPPDKLTAEKGNGSEGKPAVEVGRNNAGAEHEHRKEHDEVVRPREAAMGAPAASGIQDARRSIHASGVTQITVRAGTPRTVRQ
jgi:hypothetical protein